MEESLYPAEELNHKNDSLFLKSELNKAKNSLNLSRIKTITLILLLVNVIMLHIDITKFMKFWGEIVNYKYLFFSHILIVVFLISYLWINKNRHLLMIYRKNPILFDRILIYIYINMVLLWCVFLAVNAQGTHKQLSAYIIGIFCLASGLIQSPYESALTYLTSLIVFILLLFKIKLTPLEVSGHVINVAFLIALGIGIARIGYSSFVNSIKHRRIIQNQNLQLKNSQKHLEEAVKAKTEELTIANQSLLHEIDLRHAAEIAAIKEKLLCEEKSMLLEEAREYEALRNHFLANISHELRTPLNVILSAQQIIHSIIHNDGVEGNKINKILRHNNTIKQNCFRLIRLLNNIIDITKIDIGSLSLDVHNHNIVQVVEDITLSVVTFAEAKNISIIFDTEVEECLVACDPEKIERIMLNLLSNAIKFTPSEGYIYVNIYIQANMVVISVKDTGMGIPYEMHDKVFQRFVQVDSSMKRRQEGSGIGLSLVKLLVELHNGSIRLVSALGKGSEFIIELPITIIDDTQITSNIKASDATNNDKIERVTIEFSDIYF